MKLPRQYIPIDVRLKVIERQLYETQSSKTAVDNCLNDFAPKQKTKRLEYLLWVNFGDSLVHLDHDPPLCLREYNPKTKQYVPAANDPNYLTYIKAESHRVKTFIKGEGARRSDMGQRRYLKRVIARRNPKPRFKPRAAKHIRRTPHAPITTKNGDQVE